jgi:UDP-N-acetyl-2-amino-2-deoxyglucuronate dehydrogenase
MLIFEPMQQRVKFGIVGCGKVADRHAREAARLGDLVAVCDVDPNKATALALRFGCRAYPSMEEMLTSEPSLDVVAICTPNGLHAGQSVSALNKSIHVLCEKPLCLTENDGIRMVEAARNNNRKLFVVKSNRLNPQVIALKHAVEAGYFGRIYSFQLNCFWNRPASYFAGNWHGTDLDGGLLFTQFSHYVDTLVWLFGEIEDAKGYRSNAAGKVPPLFEDAGNAALRMKSGAIGGISWSVNSFEKNMEITLTIMAEKGSVRLGGVYMHDLTYQHPEILKGALSITESANNSNHDLIYEQLINSLADDSVSYVGGEEGLKTVSAIQQIYSSTALIS